MRPLFGCLAGLLCLVSVALAARYGYKGADTEIDGAISAVVFGLIALCACLFDAAAVRLWFMPHRLGAGVIGIIAAAALVVTFTNSLGAIAGRADTTQAQRTRAKDDTATDRGELARITRERAILASFTPATREDVMAAREAVALAEQVRVAECEKRGPKCRERETEEQTKRADLAAALANKAATDKAAKLEADAAVVRVRLAKAPPVQSANPLGAVLEQLIGAAAVVLTAWQQAIVAAVFELCLVGVMVIYELLGQSRGQAGAGGTLVTPARSGCEWASLQWLLRCVKRWGTPAIEARPAMPSRVVLPAGADRPVTTIALLRSARRAGNVKSFLLDRLAHAPGTDVEMKVLLRAYRTWCEASNLEPKGLADFAEDMRSMCSKAGIVIEADKNRVVLCRDVRFVN
jgi:hypothetical protein